MVQMADTDVAKLEDTFEDQPDGYNYVPVLVDKSPDCKLPTLEQRQFLLSPDLNFVQFQFKLRKVLNLPPEQCLFLYTHNYRIWEPTTKFGDLYKKEYLPEVYRRKFVCNKCRRYLKENILDNAVSSKSPL